MKNYKLSFVGFVLVVLIASCRKEDIKHPDTSKITSKQKGSWNALTNWSTVKVDDSTTTYYSQISDSAINTTSGLVLVYKKEGSSIQALPFQDKSTGMYWYYQISKGVLTIDGLSSVKQQDFSGQAFSYFVLTPEQISALEAKGKTKLDPMQLTYEQALELSK
jgi:hypothetical protein